MKSGALVEPSLVLRAPPAWDRLSRAAFRVLHQYRYAYATPIHDLATPACRQQFLGVMPFCQKAGPATPKPQAKAGDTMNEFFSHRGVPARQRRASLVPRLF